MPNPWGANLGTSPPYYQGTIGGADIVCNPGVETNVAQITGLSAYGPGTWTFGWLGVVGMALGATPPTTLNIGSRINNGADVAGQSIPSGLLVANAQLYLPVMMFNFPSSPTIFYPGPVSLQLSVTAGGQAVTVSHTSTALYYWVLRVGEGA